MFFSTIGVTSKQLALARVKGEAIQCYNTAPQKKKNIKRLKLKEAITQQHYPGSEFAEAAFPKVLTIFQRHHLVADN